MEELERRITVRITEETRRLIEEMKGYEGSMSDIIRNAITKYLTGKE